jgi:hypothetical protein
MAKALELDAAWNCEDDCTLADARSMAPPELAFPARRKQPSRGTLRGLRASRSFREECNRQATEAFGLSEDDWQRDRILRSGTSFDAMLLEMRHINGGRDVKLPTRLPHLLESVVEDTEWADFSDRVNSLLSRYRAGRIDNVLLSGAATMVLAPLAVPAIVLRERKRMRKTLAVLSAACASFNVKFSDRRPHVELYFDSFAARTNLVMSVQVRRGHSETTKTGKEKQKDS